MNSIKDIFLPQYYPLFININNGGLFLCLLPFNDVTAKLVLRCKKLKRTIDILTRGRQSQAVTTIVNAEHKNKRIAGLTNYCTTSNKRELLNLDTITVSHLTFFLYPSDVKKKILFFFFLFLLLLFYFIFFFCSFFLRFPLLIENKIYKT